MSCWTRDPEASDGLAPLLPSRCGPRGHHYERGDSREGTGGRPLGHGAWGRGPGRRWPRRSFGKVGTAQRRRWGRHATPDARQGTVKPAPVPLTAMRSRCTGDLLSFLSKVRFSDPVTLQLKLESLPLAWALDRRTEGLPRPEGAPPSGHRLFSCPARPKPVGRTLPPKVTVLRGGRWEVMGLWDRWDRHPRSFLCGRTQQGVPADTWMLDSRPPDPCAKSPAVHRPPGLWSVGRTV